jgi:enamine deaminase RidA (YjgF/YER057c/UK114 family)
MSPEEALQGQGETLPLVHPAVANYAMVVRTGSMLFTAGHGAFIDGQPVCRGKLGADLSTEEGRSAAEAATLQLLATVKAELGELSQVAKVLKVVVFVNSTPEFTDHHLVADGATDLLVHAFGDAGRPARSAIGVAALPLNFAVEIEAIVQTRD